MEVCYAEQDSNSSICQYEPHSHEGISHLASSELPSSAPAVGGCESSPVAMQGASEQVVWPILFKPNDVIPKAEPENVKNLHFVDANSSLNLDHTSTDVTSMQADTAIEKCKVRKRRLASEDGEALDMDDTIEKQSVMRWKDEWVTQLIHIKGRAQAALAGPQKQRVDLWQVIKSEMARTCPGFDKDTEACRKKWRRVHKEYKDDKCLRTAGNGSQKCKFYDLMDFYMGEKTSGSDNLKLTAIGYNDAHVASPGKDDQHPGLIEDAHATKRPCRRANSHVAGESAASSCSLSSLLAEFVGLGKEMLDITRRHEQETVDILHSMKEALYEISKQI